ncbi:MAG: iron-containing alcohol dehydrogenase [Eubacteriales bacterium]|nr:iron-containing alcohol dehydrogenase [Eubacteriales bacterium]
MLDFEFYTPTKVFFGKNAESNIGTYLNKKGYKKVLVVYGGGSIKRNGLFDKVVNELSSHDISYIELAGVEPNPKIDKVYEGIKLVKQHGLDFLLAVGGGSVIDTCKAIGIGLGENRDPWELIENTIIPEHSFPMGSVLTISAAGSEMSNSAVITNMERGIKRGLNCDANRPEVAFMNPENTYSVDAFQTACGVVDIMMHTFERYLTPEKACEPTDRIAEAVLLSVKEAGPYAIENPKDYNARATLMWASSLSHNNITGVGRNGCWAPHKMSLDFGALHDNITHGAALSVIFPAYCKYVMKYDVARFTRMAVNILGVPMNYEEPEKTAIEGICACERYFKSLNMPTRLHELGIEESELDKLADKTSRDGKMVFQSYISLGRKEIREILDLMR